MIDGLYERVPVNLLGKVLDISSTRQKVLSSNIANEMTPGYVKKDVRFEESLAQASSSRSELNGLMSEDRHIPLGQTESVEKPVVLADERGRDLEQDMAVSAENQLLYSTVAQIVGNQFKSLRLAIRGQA
jgi:flagellar basal-body rod protein FlgB